MPIMGKRQGGKWQHRKMQPPEKAPLGQIGLFWFLAWYKSHTGEAYQYTKQRELSEASGVSQQTISRIINNDKPEWLTIQGRALSVARREED